MNLLNWFRSKFTKQPDLGVTVTDECIKVGIRMDTNLCPIARAVKSKFPEARNVSVGSNMAHVFYDTSPITQSFKSFYLPDEAVDFIKRFDGGRPVIPFAFKLRPERL